MTSVNTAESENTQPVVHESANKLIYRLEGHPSLPQTLLVAFQHLLAMFVMMITLVLSVCRAFGLPAQDTQHIISMSLFASDVASVIQIKVWGPTDSGLPSIQDTSSDFAAPLVAGGTVLKTGDANVSTMTAALSGTLMLTSCTEIVFSHVLHLARRIITPLVSGVVMTIIDLSLIQVGLIFIGGGYMTIADHIFGVPKNPLLTNIVLALIIILNRQRNPYLRIAPLVITMAVGCLAAWFLDMLPVSTAPTSSGLITVPTPLYRGLGIDWSLLLPLMLVFMVTSLETIGDIAATSDASKQPVSGPLYMERLKGGMLANSLNSFVSAVLSTFSNSCFGQNNGMIQLTGAAGRHAGLVVALMLTVPGLFPAVSDLVQHIPESVLGGTTLVTFGTIAAPGVRIVFREPLSHRAILITALSLAVGFDVSQQLLILQFAPDWLKNLLSSGIAAGGVTATVLNLIFPPEKV